MSWTGYDDDMLRMGEPDYDPPGDFMPGYVGAECSCGSFDTWATGKISNDFNESREVQCRECGRVFQF